MKGKLLKVGILGAGFMAGTHCRSLSKLEGVEVVAVCSPSQEKGQALLAQQKLETARAYVDFATMLAAEKMDILYVCIPPYAHHGQVVKAAHRGIHLFLEKPIALNLADAEAMVAAVETADVISQVGFHYRFRKSVRAFKKMADAGELGRPTLFTGRFWCNMEGPAWWRDKAKSGGQLFEQCIHLYDLATHLFGAPATASGLMANLCHAGTPGYTIDDTSAGLILFQNGAMATVTSSNCALKDRYIGDFRVVFEKGLLDYATTGDWRVKDEAVLHREGEMTRFVEDGDPHFEATADFINAIRHAGATVTPARHGLDSLRLVTEVMAAAQGK